MTCTFPCSSSVRGSLFPFEAAGLRSTRVFYNKRRRKPTKNLRYPRRPQLPPEFGVNLFLKKPAQPDSSPSQQQHQEQPEEDDDEDEEEEEEVESQQESDVVWEVDELETITSLFQGRIPQKPRNVDRERPLPLPSPHKIRPLGLPTRKRCALEPGSRVLTSRAPVCNRVYKDPGFLIGLARQIKDLAPGDNVASVLDGVARFLRKRSLSMTIRELGLMGLPGRALQTFCWAQGQGHLYPDDKILSSTVEVLAKSNELKLPFNLEDFTPVATKGVIEAMARGFIGAGRLKLAWKLLALAKHNNRVVDAGIYAKLILELGRNPDKHVFVEALLEELAERDNLSLSKQDCTAVMKVCIRLGKFEVVENLFSWFRESGLELSVVMYTTMIHSRYSEQRYREAMALVWELEAADCLLDLPAYRVILRLFAAMGDLSRAVRYFRKLKEAGFSPTYEIYRYMYTMYKVSGRLAKCEEIRKEAELAGFDFKDQIMPENSDLSQINQVGSSNSNDQVD